LGLLLRGEQACSRRVIEPVNDDDDDDSIDCSPVSFVVDLTVPKSLKNNGTTAGDKLSTGSAILAKLK
jgi:hypothetical protein